jgi:hypothetical protein
VSVPGTGHSVFGADVTGCSERALGLFFRGRKASVRCKRSHGRIRPDGPIPKALAEVSGGGKREKTINAVGMTIFDVLEQSADSLLIDPFGYLRGGGLRSGFYYETAEAIVLRGVEFVPGVRVDGTIGQHGAADVRVSGRAASDGRLRFRGSRAAGVLDGRRVAANTVRSSASSLVSRHLSR